MIAITGGSGFIGTHLVQHLQQKKQIVLIIDIAQPKANAAKFVQASILEQEKLQKAFEGCEAVVHLAASIDVQASVQNPQADFQTNAYGTLSVLEAARKANVRKVLFACSAAVYGEPQNLPIKETHPLLPLSPYGASKLAAESYVLLYGRLYGMKNLSLRLFNVYGPGQSSTSQYAGVITKFASAIKEGRQPVIYGDGKQTRDFVHVKDVCEAFWLGLNKDATGALNIGSGKETSILEVLEALSKACGKKVQPKFLPARQGEILRSVADCSLARQKLGFEAKIDLKVGLAQLV
ncbi:MAG: GDP-mannose 4,6-dehydratase [Candidatus Anstonellaceae archaeon]